ncbi:MAG: VWA domain-containing protein [Bacteroidales bacterium]|nr:VWA domain-containing protein [Bacteroidales bacterium]
MDLFRFGNKELLNLFYVLPIFLILFILYIILKKRTLKKYGELTLVKKLTLDYSVFRVYLKFIIILFAFAFLILAVAQPQFGSKLEEVKSKGIELVIALDVSNSMLAEDISPNRLERAKLEISKLVDKLNGDKIGIIVFAGDAYTQLPMTTDYGAVKLFLKTINTNFVPKQGTSIGAALKLATDSFTPETEAGKAIIIITDGEDHEADAIEQTKTAAESGIIVHTIGMGTINGAPIPVYNRYAPKTFRKDREGNVVITKLNDKILNEIAITGGGEFRMANNASVGLKEILEKIQTMNSVEYETQKFTAFDEKFQYPIAIALILLVLDSILLNRKNRFLKNIKLFETNKNK